MNYREQDIECCLNCEFHDFVQPIPGVRVLRCRRLDSEKYNEMVYSLAICDLYIKEENV
jgi:hypothetical protein